MCSGALGLSRVVRDQIAERGVAIIVSNKESTNWKETSVKTLLREKQLEYTDVEEMRVTRGGPQIVFSAAGIIISLTFCRPPGY